MVKITIAGSSSQLAREIIDRLVATEKHEIQALVRKDPSTYPALPKVKWTQTTYQDKEELVQLLGGTHTVLSFLAVHDDPGNELEKRLIDASIEAGVKRFAPSEWSTGVGLETSLDVVPWYTSKVEATRYLESLNKDAKVIEYTRFQPGAFMNFLAHPHKTAKYIKTLAPQFDFEKKHAIVVKGSLDAHMTFTTVADIANVVAHAVDYEGEWPAIGGIRGSRITFGEMLKIGERVFGKPFTVDWLEMEDLLAGELKTDNYSRLDLPSVPKDLVESFSKTGAIGFYISGAREVWTVSDEWNRLLPDLKFTQVEDFVEKFWKE